MMRSGATLRRCTRLTSARHASTTASSIMGTNWLEADCGDVPVHPYAQDSEVSEMLRGGHAMQIASATLLDAKVAGATRGGVRSYSAAHFETLKELRDIENRAVRRIEDAVRAQGFRFRPSLMIPAVQLSSTVLGSLLSTVGDNASTLYVTGVKMAVSDYYNDQIRELYARKPELTEIKDLFKVARDEEQEFVDAHTPDALDPNKADLDAITKFANTSSKVLLQVAKAV